MTRNSRSVTRIIALLALTLVFAMGFRPAEVFAGVLSERGPVRVLSEDAQGVVLEFRLPPFHVETIDGRSRISIAGWARTSTPGLPDLPMTGTLIELPAGMTALATVLNWQEAGIPIQPVALVPQATPGGIDPETHSGPGDSRAPGIRIEKPVTIRGLSAVRLLIYPFSWDQATGTLRYWAKATINVRFEKTSNTQALRFLRSRTASITSLDKAELTGETAYPEGPRVRIEINEDGLYQISSTDLAQLGFVGPHFSPRRLQLWNRGRQVPFTIVRPDSSRIQGTQIPPRNRSRFFVRFYGTATTSRYTTTNVYWLLCATGGVTIGERDATPVPPGQVQSWSNATVVREENNGVWDQTPGAPEAEFWFWERLTAPVKKTYTVRLDAVSPDQPQQGLLKVRLRGRSSHATRPNHHTKVLWDNTLVGEINWSDTIEYVLEIPLTKGQLTEGNHSVTLDAPGDTGAPVDAVYLDRFEVQYGRLLHAAASDLRFQIAATSPKLIEITSSLGGLGEVYDVSDPYGVVRLAGLSAQAQGDAQVLRFRHPGTAPVTYYLARQPKKPASLSYWNPAGLRSAQNSADHLIVAPQEFVSALLSLRDFRQTQGLRSRVVSTEEIFNEFSHGFPEPEGIRAFLAHAYRYWQPPAPAYVLLVGDANLDYLDYAKTGKANKVPVHLTSTAFLGVTPDDSWYVCLDDPDPGDNFPDPVPDMMLGRIPGATSAQVSQTIAKILQFEQSGGKSSPRTLVVADNGEPNWEETAERLAQLIPGYFTTQKIYLSVTAAAQAKTDLLEALSQGPAFATYVGHGAVQTWAGESILRSADVPNIGNTPQNLSFVASLNCLNAYFCATSFYCLGEELVNAPEKAAVACFAPAALSTPWEHEIIGLELFSSIFNDRELRVGNAVALAKVNAYARGVFGQTLSMFTLFGDPATKLKGW